MTTLLILNDPPYGTERSYNALRLAGALAKHSHEGLHPSRLFRERDGADASRRQRMPHENSSIR
jgi:uncharacterized protein involved in oxidation of intracellular sulfur